MNEREGTLGLRAPYLSVIIATKDRAEELRNISLPSIGKQDSRDFEVIVWDASEDDASQFIVAAFATAHPDLHCRYYKAPRAGLPAQRNDAVKEASGDIVFFIDDDSDVSPDGVTALSEMFIQHKEATGGCLPLQHWRAVGEGQSISKTERCRRLLLSAFAKAFHSSARRSGAFPIFFRKHPGTIDHLAGFDMAYRKTVFRDHCFDERLQRYGGYALFEDALFSHLLHREGHILSVADSGLVVHRPAPGQRVQNAFNKGRVDGYNAGIVWRTSVFPFAPWSVIHFLWARAGFMGVVLLPCLFRPWQKERWKRVAGYLAGLWTFMLEDIQGRKSSVSIHVSM